MTEREVEMLDLDTVVIVDKHGYDEDFCTQNNPGMIGYIEQLPEPGRALLKIEIPISYPSEGE